MGRALIALHEALLRGDSPLSPAQHELIAAYVSGLNRCRYCHGVHTATAERLGTSAVAVPSGHGGFLGGEYGQTGDPDAFAAGWIPGVLQTLPEQAWAFVHLDLTLYEATLAALRYFYPRLAEGGVIICDGSAFCPGVQRAVDEFSDTEDVPYALLGYREVVFAKT